MKILRKAATLLALACAATMGAVSLPALTTQEGMDIKGYVHDGTSGIPGVLITDGYSFTRTADDGSYYLASNSKAWCVYVILPSGYEYGTVEQGIVKHFVTLDPARTEQQADFLLNPIGDDTHFTFMAHADTQPWTYVAADCWSGMMTAYKDMEATGREIAEQDGFLPFNLHMGDIIYNTNTHTDNYYQYKQNLVVCDYNIPMLTTAGNHDRRYKPDYMAATELYRAEFGPLWYGFNRGKIHFIAMDNVKCDVEGEYGRGFNADAIEWLRKYLEYIPTNEKIVFFTHQHLTRTKAIAKNYTEVLNMLSNYQTLVITGHLHRTLNNFPEYHPNIRERNMPALGGGGWRGPCCTDGTPNGYCIYTVDGDEISWKYKWTRRDPDKYMFRLYNPGDLGAPSYKADEDKIILANVWDWDDAWKVTWKMDGTDMGDLPRYESAKDPWAAYCLEFTDEDTNESSGIKDTYHVFHADVPATCAKVEVTVTDRFGRSSSSSLTLAHTEQDGIEAITAETSGVETTDIYSIAGVHMLSVDGYPYADTLPLPSGLYLLRLRHTDGSVTTEKVHIP